MALIGHSMGGALITLAAAEGSGDALVLLAPYFAVTRKWYYGLAPETWSRITSPCIRWVYKGDVFKQVNRKEVRDQFVSYRWVPVKSAVMLSRIALQARDPAVLDAVTQPLLLIHARGDNAASPKAAEIAFQAIASTDKSLVWLERSNHVIAWDYDHEIVRETILSFLSRVAPVAE